MTSLASIVADVGSGSLEDSVFGTVDPAGIADRMTDLLADLGAAVADWHWYVRSVACVAGARLADGREVVARAFQPTVRPAFLEGVIRMQTHLAEAGFPTARPLGGPVVREWGLGRVETLLADPGARRLGPETMSTSATGLARLVELAAEVDPTGLELHPMVAGGQLYPPPHNRRRRDVALAR